MGNKKEYIKKHPKVKVLRHIAIGMVLASTLLRICVGKLLNFSTESYQLAPEHLTIGDYLFIFLILSIPITYALSYLTKKLVYMHVRQLFYMLIVAWWALMGFAPGLSYISYGWQFSYHDYFLPPFIPGTSLLHIVGFVFAVIQCIGIYVIVSEEKVMYNMEPNLFDIKK